MYDDLAELYDLFIDWPARLATEMPLLLRLGVGEPGQIVVDAACGTGQHARALAEAGCRTVAYDASAEMVAVARDADEAGAVEWVVGTFDEVRVDEQADALICIGTSLPHVTRRSGYRLALRAFRGALQRDGILVIHSRNLRRTTVGGERFLPPIARQGPDGTVLFWRFYDQVSSTHLDFNLAILRPEAGTPERAQVWSHKVVTSRLCVVDPVDFTEYAEDAGFRDVKLFGHLDGRPFDEESSLDIVLTARAG